MRIRGVILASLLLFIPIIASAAFDISPNSVKEGDLIKVTCLNRGDINFSVYVYSENNPAENINSDTCEHLEAQAGEFFSYEAIHGESLIFFEVAQEFGSSEAGCSEIGSTECAAIAVATGVTNHLVVTRGDASSFVAYRPEIEIIKPQGGSYSDSLNIEYRATDKNDSGGAQQKEQAGLGALPVTVFYSDQIDTWDQRIVLPELKKLIVGSLKAVGEFLWKVTELAEGSNYRIIVDALDNIGDIGEAVSEFFSIDHTAPTFIVKSDPSTTKGEDVKISIEASEALAGAPFVAVTQRGYQPVEVAIKGENEVYEGVYRVITGYDGVATIKVKGKDRAGNSGELILSGGRFNVGLEPPPKPVVTYPLDRDTTVVEVINIRGTAREDLKLNLLVNGKDIHKTSPDNAGNFEFKNVKLDPLFNKGLNILAITATDETGRISEESVVRVKFNIDPEVAIVFPKPGDKLKGRVAVNVQASDKNQDQLLFIYEISRDKGVSWFPLAEKISSRQYLWDTTQGPDGQYILRVTVDDGSSVIQVLSGSFEVENKLPIIYFPDGEKTVVSKSDYAISGTVRNPFFQGSGASLFSLEYSRDGGKIWNAINPDDGLLNSSVENFTVRLSGLEEKSYRILFRSQNDQGLYGRAVKIVAVDFGPPLPPKISTPVNDAILGAAQDLDKDAAGVQFNIGGIAEPFSEVFAEVGGAVFSGKTSAKGVFNVLTDLRKHGVNDVRIYAKDDANNKSGEVTLKLVQNNPPSLRFLNPRDARGLSGRATVRWEVEDIDGDQIKQMKLNYRASLSLPFRVLTENTGKSSFDFNVSNLADSGGHQFKLEATDGVSGSEKIVDFYVDNTAPTIFVNNLPKEVFTKTVNLSVSGSASDNLSGVEFIEYSFDSQHWFKTLITSGFLGKQANFKVSQAVDLNDGEYEVQFRSVDAAGNSSPTVSKNILVDTNPPRIGSFTLSSGILTILPEEEYFKIPKGATVKFIISLEQDTAQATLKVGDQLIDLEKNSDTALWNGEIILSKAGDHQMSVTAKDKLGNVTKNKPIGSIKSVLPGLVVSADGEAVEGVSLEVLVHDQETSSYRHWQGETYELENPTKSKENGNYSIVLPEGKYRILTKKSGFARLRSSEFSLDYPRFITSELRLIPRSGFRGYLENMLEKLEFINL